MNCAHADVARDADAEIDAAMTLPSASSCTGVQRTLCNDVLFLVLSWYLLSASPRRAHKVRGALCPVSEVKYGHCSASTVR